MRGAVETMIRRGRIARASRVLTGLVVLSGAVLVAVWETGCGALEPAPSEPAEIVDPSSEPGEKALPSRDFTPGDYAGYNLIVI